jgi:hypothetical protein
MRKILLVLLCSLLVVGSANAKPSGGCSGGSAFRGGFSSPRVATASLYPNGQVVNQNGYVVGTYVNGQFTPVDNGQMVAQAVPSDAGEQVVQPQPVVIQTRSYDNNIIAGVLFAFVFILVILVIVLLLDWLGD